MFWLVFWTIPWWHAMTAMTHALSNMSSYGLPRSWHRNYCNCWGWDRTRLSETGTSWESWSDHVACHQHLCMSQACWVPPIGFPISLMSDSDLQDWDIPEAKCPRCWMVRLHQEEAVNQSPSSAWLLPNLQLEMCRWWVWGKLLRIPSMDVPHLSMAHPFVYICIFPYVHTA